MTKEQASAIPEELYNLTQLAEVTLAAGRLSTTNVTEITDYIKKKCYNSSQHSANDDGNHRVVHDPDSQLRTDVHSIMRSAITVNPATSKCWASPSFDPLTKITVAAAAAAEQQQTAPGRSEKAQKQNKSSFFSSSDDDSNYYSHKIFDRKKIRRSTISENSRYDELSCSSIPSCSGDENFCNLSGSGSGLDRKASSSSSSSSSADSVNGFMDDEHACPECGKKYSTSSNLARHRQTHRSILDKKARRCPHCEKVYVSMPAYSMHVRTHNQGCECHYCGKCFSRPWLLQGHIRTHTGEKPFKCTVCTKAFADKSNLRAHIQTHSNTKPHSCVRCGKSFALKSYLYKHEESSCMKNHQNPKSEKSIAIGMTTTTTTTTTATATTTISVAAVTSVAESAATKSTLASKILQKEKDRRRDPNNISSSESSVATTTTDVLTELAGGKSYVTLTTSSSISAAQDNYDRFNRISVIRTPIASAIGGLPHHYHQQQFHEERVNFYHHHLQQTQQLQQQQQLNHHHHHCQDTPIDYAPKNNFSHSTKTSPFELTSNYAVVA